jgi:4-amino-4-deoxychorismate lyase
MFVETIRIENKKALNIKYHNIRINKTIYENYNIISDIDLGLVIDTNREDITKCRVLYNKNIIDIEYIKYHKKNIKSFKIISTDMEYKYKYQNRDMIVKHLDSSYDDIIITKDGLIRDISYANIAVRIDKVWYTPKNYLLYGTMLGKMIENSRLILKDITIQELQIIEKFAIINSMIGFYIIKDFRYGN